ncbi:MAG: hypothetical protein M0Z53_14315 [Thermaerobacter sp.]|nr:hypothetical protein [Thermaerobacter sp.]
MASRQAQFVIVVAGHWGYPQYRSPLRMPLGRGAVARLFDVNRLGMTGQVRMAVYSPNRADGSIGTSR